MRYYDRIRTLDTDCSISELVWSADKENESVDHLIDRSGNFTKITHISEPENKEIYELTTEDGIVFRAEGFQHLMLQYEMDHRPVQCCCTLAGLAENYEKMDFYLVDPAPIDKVYDGRMEGAYSCGVILGNSIVTENGEIVLTDLPIYARSVVREELPVYLKPFGMNSYKMINGETGNPYSSPIFTKFPHLNVNDLSSFIPSWDLRSSILENRVDFLRGVFCKTINQDDVSISLAKEGANSVVEIARSLGIRASITPDKMKGYFTIRILPDNGINLLKVDYSYLEGRNHAPKYTQKVKSCVLTDRIEPCVSIGVDSPDGSYLGGNCFVCCGR